MQRDEKKREVLSVHHYPGFSFSKVSREKLDGGGLTVYVLLSLVNKETALAFNSTAA